MNRNKRTEKEATSFRVEAKVSSKSSKRFQDLANLKILSSLKPRNAVITLPDLFWLDSSRTDYATIISTRLAMTISKSNVLNHEPLKKLLKPNANNLIIVSTTNIPVNTKLSFSKIYIRSSSIGYLSSDSTKVFRMIAKIMNALKF